MEQILKASYGDKAQREANNKDGVTRALAAARIEQDFKERRAANPRAQHPAPPSGNDPLFWDRKNQGTPYGEVQREPARHVKVEIRPGVYHVVESAAQQAVAQARGSPVPGAGPPGVRGGGRPQSAPIVRKAAGGPSPGASPSPSRDLGPAVAQMEDRLREALRQRAAVHIKERTVLLQAFGVVIGRRHVDIGVRDKVSPDQFIAVMRQFSLTVSQALAGAFFAKYGQDARGMMPVMNFTEALVMGSQRLLMAANQAVQKGAYLQGKPATHMGKILYPECKAGVWPPSDWNPQLAERSSQLPDVRLSLEFVHGYDGFQATSPNIFYTATGEIVYHVAALGVVYNKAAHTQRFFLSHDDDVLCTAIHPDRMTVATGQLGKAPCVMVWDTATCKQLARLPYDREYRGVQAVAFSPDGTRLASISTDNSHSLHVWDWARKAQLCQPRKSQQGAPPAVYGLVWSKYEPDRLVSYGQNHIRFWRLGHDPKGQAGALEPGSEAGIYSIGKTYTVLSALFLRSGIVLAGNADGVIGAWRGNKLVRETQAHNPGPVVRRPDGKPSYGGIRCLVLQRDAVMLSGGADGMVKMWDVSGGDLGPLLRQFPLLRADQIGTQAPPAIRGLDCDPKQPEMFVAGTASCDIWEVDKDPEVLVYGQQADLYGLAMNAAFPHVYVTACDSDKVAVWSATTCKPIRIVSLGGLTGRGCAFSPDGQHLAVGCTNGGITVLEFHPAVRQVFWGKPFSSAVDELKYSPCGRFLAAGSHDQAIEILDVRRGYARICRCSGHSSTVRHIDWSADSTALMANDQAYEILYFDPMTGRSLKDNQRDTRWAGWTCLLGFPVMGVWFPDSDGTDINAVAASPSGRYVLTADDKGRVRLLNFPSVVQSAPAHVYCGHSSHVMGVRWSADETFAVSVGGKDRAIFQWRVVQHQPQQRQQGPTPWAQMDDKGLMWAAPQQQQQGAGYAAGGGGGGSPAHAPRPAAAGGAGARPASAGAAARRGLR